MISSKHNAGLNPKIIIALCAVVILVAVGGHSAQYLPATPGLFLVVFIARMAMSLGIALAMTMLWAIFLKLSKSNTRAYGFWFVFAVTGAIVAATMTAMSFTNEVSEGLLQLYLQ